MASLLPLPSGTGQDTDDGTSANRDQSAEIGSTSRHGHRQFSNDADDPREEIADDSYRYDGQVKMAETSTDTMSSDDSEVRERSWFRPRPADDDEPEDWWFASTAIPLLAATIGPLANVLSIASIVSKWRVRYDPNQPGIQDAATDIDDPAWEIALNAVSLGCGALGNMFLLFNFTRAVRYIIALPATIVLWFIASGLLIGTLSCIAIYAPPNPDEGELWGQAFWYAVMATVLYTIAAMLLMINMLGYFLGHYTQHFELTDEQRNLILQTMMFFTWLAGGAGVFSTTSSWSYSDALYFCDVTILTVGFGDYAAPNDLGRGLVFPFSVGGIIMLGLVIASISKFARQIGHTKIVNKRTEARRARTVERAVTTSIEAKERCETATRRIGARPTISAPFDLQRRTIAFDNDVEKGDVSQEEPPPPSQRPLRTGLKRQTTVLSTINEGFAKTPMFQKLPSRRPKIIVLKEERDRFNAMRAIQDETRRFKRYFALCMSVLAFGLLWCVGAIVFWQAEQDTQGLTYFQALYFCYVSLLTIGYGDLSPKSNAGKPFFVVWSLIAVPTMTILVSDLGDTVIAAYKRGTFTLADWSILPKQGLFADFAHSHPKLKAFLEQWQTNRRIERGFDVGPDPLVRNPSTIEQLAAEGNLDEHDMAKRLAKAIRSTADHMKSTVRRRYTYEEWVELTRLIRFTKYDEVSGNRLPDPDAKGLIEWDWIGENSPMMSDQHESEWVMDRLCESLDRYMHRMVPEHVKERRRSQAERRRSIIEGRRVFTSRRKGSSASKVEGRDESKIEALIRRDTSSELRRPSVVDSVSGAESDAGRSTIGSRDRDPAPRAEKPAFRELNFRSYR